MVYFLYYLIKLVETIVNLLNYEKINKEEKFKTNNYLEKNYQINCIKLILHSSFIGFYAFIAILLKNQRTPLNCKIAVSNSK